MWRRRARQRTRAETGCRGECLRRATARSGDLTVIVDVGMVLVKGRTDSAAPGEGVVDPPLPCGVLRHDQFESVLRDRRENGDRLGLILRLGFWPAVPTAPAARASRMPMECRERARAFIPLGYHRRGETLNHHACLHAPIHERTGIVESERPPRKDRHAPLLFTPPCSSRSPACSAIPRPRPLRGTAGRSDDRTDAESGGRSIGS